MTDPNRCELCDDPLVDGHDRVGGLALCRRCFVGDLRQILEPRLWTLWSDHREYTDDYDTSAERYQTIVRITVPCEPGLELTCVRRDLRSLLRGLLRRRARSQDPLFDAHVLVWTPHPPRVEQLLRSPGIEGSILEALGNMPSSRVTLCRGQLEVDYISDERHTEGVLVARACVLAHHLQRHATSSLAVSAR